MDDMIPKNMHFIWWQGKDRMPDQFNKNLKRWAQKNPEWKIHIWDSESFGKLLSTYSWLTQWRFLRIPLVKGAAFPEIKRVDAARLLIAHRMGGAYFDLDMIALRPVSDFLTDEESNLRLCSKFGRINDDDIRNHLEPVRHSEYHTFFFREILPFHRRGFRAVANGCFITTEENDLFLDAFNYCYKHRKKPVLNAFGPHRMSEWLKRLVGSERKRKGVLVAGGYYTLWDQKVFGPPYPWVVCAHDGANPARSWGDPNNKEEPWKI